MTTSTPVYAARTLIAAGTSNAAGATTEGTPLDLRGKFGGMLTAKITNGATGPTVQATIQVLAAVNDSSTPAAGGEGSNWKLIYEIGGGTDANAVTRIRGMPIYGFQHVHARVTGNTGQAVTCEAYMTEFSSVSSA
ncbi:MAG: hypothetical protein KDH16_21115, partial [Rhodocyclaceae bacterium]|nr:hypothetical protein [Rhodocyclaceae bacterium]HQU89100.1 hypothetical protein [Denitromonas sp.]